MKSFYLCNVFFIVLDLRLTRLGLGGVLFLCPYLMAYEVTLSRKSSNMFGFSLNFLYNFGFAEVTPTRK